MRKFREGDVVRFPNDELGNERVVDLVGDDRIRCADGWWYLIREGALPTLLRRPVRVGDVLRVGRTSAEFPAEADVISAGRYRSPWFEHADGTPIEPPRETETAAVRFAQAAARVSEIETLAGWGAISGEDARLLKQMAIAELDAPRSATQGAGAMVREETSDVKEYRFRIGADSYGVVHLDGKLVRHLGDRGMAGVQAMYREVTAMLRTFVPPLPTVEQLARALHATDPRVCRFVRERSECPLRNSDPFRQARVGRNFDTAWERNEGGWRTEAEDRARAILDVLGGGR